MLDVGTLISYDDTESGTPLQGKVVSCNRRGSRCSVELRPGELQLMDLNKTQYKVVVGEEAGNGQAASRGQEQSAPEGGSDGGEVSGDDAQEGGSASEEGDSELEELDLPPLDAFDEETRGAVDDFCSSAIGPEAFAQPSQELAESAKQGLKAVFAFISSSAPEWAPKASLPELYVDGFDAEQIWGQLEAAAGPTLKHLRKRLKPMNEDIMLLDEETEAALDELMKKGTGGSSVDSEGDDDDSKEAIDDELEGLEAPEEDVDRLETNKVRAKRSKKGAGQANNMADRDRLPTEDDFLRLDDMEQFVQDAEEAAMQGNASENDADGSGDDEDDDDLGGGMMEGLNEAALGEDEALEEESNSDEEDAQLARLLESASDIVGKKKQKRKREAESDEDEAYFYDDFFGSGPQSGVEVPTGSDQEEEEEEGILPGGEDLSDFELDWDGEGEVGEDHEEGGSEGREDEDRDDPEGDRAQLLGTLQRMLDDKRAEEAAGEGDMVEPDGKMSGHEQRLARMAQRARRLEEENMGEKDWFMRGETKSGGRPLNSALEIDMDFDRALKPPPQPTEEFTSSLEDLIKRRIVDRQFDDPARREPPPDDLNKELAELDDKRSAKGLGEVYEEDYVRAKTGNAVEDKDEATRLEAKLLLKGLFAKLDALSHFHFAPKPIIKEMSVQSEVPALAMEEVAPQVVSEAARQLPEEVYKAPKPSATKTGEVIGKAERKRSRAAHKRGFKNRLEQEVDGGKKAASDGKSNIVGRKSADDDASAAAAEKKSRKKAKRKRGKEEDGPTGPKIKYTKSAAVFGKIQDAINSKGASKFGASKLIAPTSKSSKNLKL